MEPHLTTELELMQDAKERLSTVGLATLIYNSAEFSPYSNQKKPDILFFHNKLPNTAYIIEFKLLSIHQTSPYHMQIIPEHRDFAKDGYPGRLQYIFATNGQIDAETNRFLCDNGIIPMSGINTGFDLFTGIIRFINNPE